MLARPTRRAAVLAAALLLQAAAAGAAEPPADGAPRAASEEEVAAMVIVLREQLARRPEGLDAIFRLGVALLEAAQRERAPGGAPWSGELRKNLYGEAARAFAHVQRRRPARADAHLYLAHALFQRGDCARPPEDLWAHLLGDDCDASERHYRRILAEEHPPAVVRQIRLFLHLLRERRRIRRSFHVAVAPDSNVNTATEARTVATGIQLPGGEGITLSKEARQTSGVGLLLSAAAEYQRPLDLRLHERSRTRLRAGGGLYRRDYGGSAFDDMTLSLHAGPRFEFADRGLRSVSALAKVNRSWYGGKTYSSGRGLRLEADGWLGERTWWGASLERMRLHHRRQRRFDGPRLDATARAAHIATPALTVHGRGGWRRFHTEDPRQRYDSWWGGVGADYALPPVFGAGGFVAGLSYDRHHRYSDNVNIIDGPFRRRDRLGILRLSLLNRTLELGDFTPELALVREERKSNAERFRYKRSRVEVGLRRLF